MAIRPGLYCGIADGKSCRVGRDCRRGGTLRHPVAMVAVFAPLLFLAACTSVLPRSTPDHDTTTADDIRLFSPAFVLEDYWQEISFAGHTRYRIDYIDDRLALRAEGRESASGMIRRVKVDPLRCPTITWDWRADTIQTGAHLADKSRSDVVASIYLLFGDPGFLVDPRQVPTLRYVWTGGDDARDRIIDSAFLPGTVRNIVVENGDAALGQWLSERRNVVADYRRAFGGKPAHVHAVALFTDNDQTGEPVVAYYGEVHMACTSRESGSD